MGLRVQVHLDPQRVAHFDLKGVDARRLVLRADRAEEVVVGAAVVFRPEQGVGHVLLTTGPIGPRRLPAGHQLDPGAQARSVESFVKVKRLPPPASRFTLLKTPLPAAAVSLACLASPSGPTPIVYRRFHAVEPHHDCVWHREPSGTSPSSIYSKVREDARTSQRLRCTCHTRVADQTLRCCLHPVQSTKSGETAHMHDAG